MQHRAKCALALVALLAVAAACRGAGEASSNMNDPPASTASTPERPLLPQTTTSLPEPTQPPIQDPSFEERLPSRSPEQVELVIGPDEVPIVSYWQRREADAGGGVVVLLRCTDPRCDEDIIESEVAVGVAQDEWRLAGVLGDDPVFLIGPSPAEPERTALWVCHDPGCQTGSSLPVDFDGWPLLEFTQSPVFTDTAGHLNVVMRSRSRVGLARCHDSDCTALDVWQIADSGGGAVRVSDVDSSDGSVVMLWSDERTVGPAVEGEPDAKSRLVVTICPTGSCDVELVTVDLGPGRNGFVFSQGDVVMVVGVPRPDVRSAPPFTFTCVDKVCSSGDRAVPGFQPMIEHRLEDGTESIGMPVWVFDPEFPLDWWSEENPNEGGRITTWTCIWRCEALTGSDGMPFVVFSIEGRLVATRCDDANCQTGTTHVLARSSDEDVEGFDVEIGIDGRPLIVYETERGIYLIRCPDAACTPPES